MKRTANFNELEVAGLIDTVIKYKNILENKESSAVMWKEKEYAWEKVASQFNSTVALIPRTAKVLKLKYENIKRDLKKKEAENKKELYRTGGGPKKHKDLTDYEEKLLAIIKISVEGLDSRNDCDFIGIHFINIIFYSYWYNLIHYF